MKEKKGKGGRNSRKEMFRQKFYNEKRIKGYNHLTGTLDVKTLPDSRGGIREYKVTPEVRSLCECEY